jgi:hypothetical protein
MQTANSQVVAATRKAIVANGVSAYLTTFFGTNFAMRGPDLPLPPGPEVVYPMAFLVEQSAGSTVQAHFHAANQFQVVVAGRGVLGRHEVAPISLHYTNAFSSYGPIRAGEEGLHYFTLRNGYDPGARYVPGAAAEMRGRPRKFREAAADPGPPMAVEALAALQEARSESLLPPADDGLAAWRHHLPPGARLRGPNPATGDGQYWVLAAGSLTVGDTAPMPALSCIFVFPHDPAPEVAGGADGADILVLQYPRGRAHLAPG